jgi:hypothetical protein
MSINLLDFLCPDECFLHDELADDRVVLDDDGNEICPVMTEAAGNKGSDEIIPVNSTSVLTDVGKTMTDRNLLLDFDFLCSCFLCFLCFLCLSL